MGTRRLDITCIVSIHYTVPLQCWGNGVSWWQSLELQEQCQLDPAGVMAIVDLGTHHGHREFGPPALYHGRLGLMGRMVVDPPIGALGLEVAVDPPPGALDLPATADKAVAQNEQDNACLATLEKENGFHRLNNLLKMI